MKLAEILAKQLSMNIQTWAALQRHGVTEETPLRLDFSYNAPNRKAADALHTLLQTETDYDLRVESTSSFLTRKWRLEGTTQATRISQSILDEWVAWMINAGARASCEFDGWGASV